MASHPHDTHVSGGVEIGGAGGEARSPGEQDGGAVQGNEAAEDRLALAWISLAQVGLEAVASCETISQKSEFSTQHLAIGLWASVAFKAFG